MKVEIADNLLKGIAVSEDEARLDLAVGLFIRGRATLGRGARIAGLCPTEFLHELGRRGVPVHYDLEDFEDDVQTLSVLEL